ncbi:MAG: WD40 repeat domain-containing protein [Salinibacter sp.]
MTALLRPSPAQAQDEASPTRIEFLKYGSKATTVAVSGNGTYIAIGARDVPTGGSRAVLWNRVTQEPVWTASYSTNEAPRVALDSTGTRTAVATPRTGVTIWHLDSSRTTLTQAPSGPVHELAFGPRGILGLGGSLRQGGTARVWPNGLSRTPSDLETTGPIRSIAFSATTPKVLLSSNDTHVTLWNYRFNTTKRIDVYDRCRGLVRQVEMPTRPTFFYVITRRRAECDPDYLCTIRLEDKTVIDRFRRKNISNVEHIRDGLVAFSRGRYVYTLDLQRRKEQIVFTSENKVHDLSYAAGHLVVANSNVVVLDL